ncbi:hypothetical protein N473_24190 [Pseudoalteromonas luteoviolacea CPMOR-1]|uniref:Lipoprotein n=1 Tax=Pseudoalteromonas luteoviolacea CPMOR-1 TaxID=1365248 RepID=A0A161YI00_9GAMM|nr:hypothetical protein [Pseudoalteromonas luteoviolacea]KZN60589.1 hypothetical protein N473_24190 [Pseudoalteromonas luteoviolacea CPMOR-1]
MLLRARFWVALSVFALSACQTTNNQTQSTTQIPCWLQNPVTQDQLGFIGTAAPQSATKDGSIIASRQRAALQLTQYYDLPNINKAIAQLSAEKNQLTLANGQRLYFSEPYVTSNTLYTYASIQPINDSLACQEVSCNFSVCEPTWLCNGGSNHVIGASYYTALPHKQLAMTNVNANALAGYLDQAHVNMQEYYFESYSEQHHKTHFSRHGEVRGSTHQKPLLLSQSCNYGSTLLANYKTNKLNIKPYTKQSWRKIKQYEGRSIVMGNFGEDGKIAPDNLISSAIKYAIRDALVELAKNKGLTVSASTTLLNKNGRYFLNTARFDIQQTVSGQLLDIQINYKAGFPVVYVWLLESKT